MNRNDIKSKIQKLVNAPLSKLGYKSQLALDPIPHERDIDTLKFRKAGVVCAIVQTENPYILLIRRAYHPKDKHSGQIGFPGGGFEPQDKNLADTAVREFREEIGVTISNDDVVMELTEVVIPASRYVVFPFLVVLDDSYDLSEYSVDKKEVAEVLKMPIADLMSEDTIRQKEIEIGGRTINVKCYDMKSYYVWGATAMMLTEVKEIIKG